MPKKGSRRTTVDDIAFRRRVHTIQTLIGALDPYGGVRVRCPGP